MSFRSLRLTQHRIRLIGNKLIFLSNNITDFTLRGTKLLRLGLVRAVGPFVVKIEWSKVGF